MCEHLQSLAVARRKPCSVGWVRWNSGAAAGLPFIFACVALLCPVALNAEEAAHGFAPAPRSVFQQTRAGADADVREGGVPGRAWSELTEAEVFLDQAMKPASRRAGADLASAVQAYATGVSITTIESGTEIDDYERILAERHTLYRQAEMYAADESSPQVEVEAESASPFSNPTEMGAAGPGAAAGNSRKHSPPVFVSRGRRSHRS